MRKVLKEMLRPFDCLILVAAVFLFATFDYDNLTTADKVYIVTFTLWFAMFIIRGVIMYRGGNKRRGKLN